MGAADALEGLVDENAQDLALRLPRHVGDLVDEQRAEMGLLERADLALLAAVRLLDAEQLDLHPLRRDGGGVDDDEGRGRAVGQRMDGARGQLLAGARGPTIRMRLLVGATFSMVWRSWLIAPEPPTRVAE